MERSTPSDALALGIHAPAHGGDAVGRPMQTDAAGLGFLGAEAASEQVF
jgi:hypothetical protein